MIFEGLREADFLEKKWSPHTKKKKCSFVDLVVFKLFKWKDFVNDRGRQSKIESLLETAETRERKC